MMKMKKRFFALSVCLLVLMASLCGCTVEQDTARLEPYCNAVLLALMEGDYDAGYEVMQNAATREAYDTFCEQVAPLFEGVESFALKQRGWHKNTTNGVTSIDVVFEATLSNGRSYIVTCTETEGVEGLTGFHIQESDKNIAADTPIGLRIAFVILSLACIVLSVWMIVDCIKRKPDGMAFWIVLMLCTLKFTLTLIGGELDAGLGVGLVLMFSSVSFNSANLLITLSLPVGAIVYFFLRKRLPSKKAETQNAEPIDGTCAESPAQEPTQEFAQEPAETPEETPEETPADEPKND